MRTPTKHYAQRTYKGIPDPTELEGDRDYTYIPEYSDAQELADEERRYEEK